MLLDTYGLLRYCIRPEFTSSGLNPLKPCLLELKHKQSFGCLSHCQPTDESSLWKQLKTAPGHDAHTRAGPARASNVFLITAIG